MFKPYKAWTYRHCSTFLIVALALRFGWLSDAVAETAPGPRWKLTVQPDRTQATYAVDEPVSFLLSLTRDGEPVPSGKVLWSITQDGVDPTTQGEVNLENGRAMITGKLGRPGFLQCKAVFKGDEGLLVRGIGGAAVAPLDIAASSPPPDDFDSFWKDQIAKLPPLDARLTPLKNSPEGLECFDVSATAVGERPMQGYYARPQGAKPKSCPAVITLEGAGVYSTRTEPWLYRLAQDGFLSLELNAHGLPSGLPSAYYLDLERDALKGYELFGRTSRESFYFLNMYLRALQGVNFLTAQPEWDGRILIANGTSQGAAQSLAVAALDPRISFVTALVPAMCDHSGILAARVVGWPRLVPVDKAGQPDTTVLETSRYFDSMNFATRLKAPAIFVTGFVDQITPPTSVYAAYNQVRSPKEMIDAVSSPHRLEGVYLEKVRERMIRHARTGE